MSDDNVFFILRHINTEGSNRLWQECYRKIRIYYPENKIYIIDDNSPMKATTTMQLYNCEIIESEYPGRGEVLPYYYFHKLRCGKKAIFLHDSVFINSYIDFHKIDTYKYLFSFKPGNHGIDDDIRSILNKCTESSAYVNLYNDKSKWLGCFGAMVIISLDFLDKLVEKSNFIEICLTNIFNRHYRMCFERIISILCLYYATNDATNAVNLSYFGDIYAWCYSTITPWGTSYDDYYPHRGRHEFYKVTKVWSGR